MEPAVGERLCRLFFGEGEAESSSSSPWYSSSRSRGPAVATAAPVPLMPPSYVPPASHSYPPLLPESSSSRSRYSSSLPIMPSSSRLATLPLWDCDVYEAMGASFCGKARSRTYLVSSFSCAGSHHVRPRFELSSLSTGGQRRPLQCCLHVGTFPACSGQHEVDAAELVVCKPFSWSQNKSSRRVCKCSGWRTHKLEVGLQGDKAEHTKSVDQTLLDICVCCFMQSCDGVLLSLGLVTVLLNRLRCAYCLVCPSGNVILYISATFAGASCNLLSESILCMCSVRIWYDRDSK